jgi:transcriptional regulator with XRE-family HTH domain
MGELNLSKAELARRAHLNPNTITAVCRGDETMPSTLQKVCDALGLTLAELFTPKEGEQAGVEEPGAA